MPSKKKHFSYSRLIPLLILIIALILFFSFELYQHFTFASLQTHRKFLLDWTEQHYALATLLYIGIYIIMAATSIPGAAIMTITGGFLFGVFLGTLYVVIGATVGATIIFIAAKTALADLLTAKAGPWLEKMEKGFQDNALSYLLILRLIPIFPFWLVNIVPGLLNVRTRIFVVTTLIGIIPGSAVYTSLGHGVASVFDAGGTPNLTIIFKPAILLPLIGLAVLSLIPIVYKKIKKRQAKHHEQ